MSSEVLTLIEKIKNKIQEIGNDLDFIFNQNKKLGESKTKKETIKNE
jgi:hypothetical protein